MDGWKNCSSGLYKAAGVALCASLLAAVFLNIFLSTALAGTETGEFCPTCPDWTDLDGWLAKKDAYERAQQNSGQQNNAASNPSIATPKTQEKTLGYANPDPLTQAFPTSLPGERVVVDVRTPDEYGSGHIPGARSLYWKSLQKEGIVDPGSAQSALRRAGINSSDRLLICGGSDEGAAAVFWALSYLGQGDLSLLDGGADAAWNAGVKPDKLTPAFPESNYTVQIIPWLLVTQASLDGLLGLSDVQILDARDFSEYGRSRLTNESLPFSVDKIFDGSRMKDASALQDLMSRRSLDRKGTQIVYGTPEAYPLFFALRLMGYNATLIEGDWWKETRWAVREVR